MSLLNDIDENISKMEGSANKAISQSSRLGSSRGVWSVALTMAMVKYIVVSVFNKGI